MRAFALCSLLAIAGCSADVQDGRYAMEPGDELEISFPADTKKMVKFGFELGSESWDAASKCPKRSSALGSRMKLKLCGGLFDANNPKTGAYIESQFGGGVEFKPVDGKITVILRNYAETDMVYELKVEG